MNAEILSMHWQCEKCDAEGTDWDAMGAHYDACGKK